MKVEKVLIIISIFFLLFIGFFHKISAITQDLGRHFLLGEIILKTHSIPLTNLFSYTYPDFPFINLHWLSEVFFYLIFIISGFNGLLIISTLIVLVSFYLVFSKSVKTTPLLSLTIGSVLYLRVLFERTDIRPEIFSFLFLSLFISILYSYRKKHTRLIFILPLIELLWVNMHIYFIVGIAVLGLFLIDSIIMKFKRGELMKFLQQGCLNRSEFRSKKILLATSAPVVTLIIILILSILATLINPSGIKGALYPFHVFNNYGYQIEENQNIFFLWQYSQKQTIIYFALSSTLLFLSLLFSLKKVRIIDWMLSIFFTILAITAIRNFPLFVFATFIPFMRNLSILTDKIALFNKKIIVIPLFLIILWQITQVLSLKEFGLGVETGAKPAADFYLKNNLKGPIFNNFDIGSYLEYRFYPKEKVFVDGRPGEYPVSFFQEVYIPMQLDKNIFEKTDQKYKFNTIFFSYTDQTPWGTSFVKQIVTNDNWKIIYLDDYVIILAKNNSENKNLIEKFLTNIDHLKISNLNNNDFNSLLRLALFFNKTGLMQQEIEIHQKILSIKPDFCPSLYNLSVYLIKDNNPAGNIWASKYNNQCK